MKGHSSLMHLFIHAARSITGSFIQMGRLLVFRCSN
jgi:hypothetical protein